MGRHGAACGLIVAVIALTAGCAFQSSAAPRSTVETPQPEMAQELPRVTEASLRASLMSFADRLAVTAAGGVAALESAVDTPLARQRSLHFRIYTLTAAYELAVAPNPSIALIELVTLTTLTRYAWEDHWRDKVFGEAAQPVVDALKESEADIWSVAASVMTETQMRNLERFLVDWRRAHPDRYIVSHLRLAEIASAEVSFIEEAKKPAGFLGIKQAISTVEATQALFDRTLWFLTRLQLIARWQVELTYVDIMNSEELVTMRADFHELMGLFPELPGDIADRSLTVSRELLREITVEREAAINQILQGFADERRQTLETIAAADGPRAALAELRGTIEASNALLARVDGLIPKIEPMLAASGEGPAASGRPFDINEYRDAAEEARLTVGELRELVGALDSLLASSAVSGGAPALVEAGNDLVLRLATAAAILIVIALVGLLAVLLAYRWFSARMGPVRQ